MLPQFRVHLLFSTLLIIGPLAALSARADAIQTTMVGAEAWGDTNNAFPFNAGGWVNGSGFVRTQQIYDLSAFQTPITSPAYITQIAFRQDANPFTVTYPDIRIELSTTTRNVDGLHADFAANTGADAKVAYEGALPLYSLQRTGDSSTPGPFDIVINLQKPFLYDPSAGRLLLDVVNPNGGIRASQFDATDVLGDAVSRLYSYTNNGSMTTGTTDTTGLITRFTFSDDPTPIPQPDRPEVVPEPTSFAVFGLALAAAGFAARRRPAPAGAR